VTGTLAIDTILFFVVVRSRWHRSLKLVLGGAAAFLFVDLAFLSANLTKVLHGGWFPLAIALVVFVTLTTWHRGRALVTARRTEEEGPLRAYVERLRTMEDGPVRVPGAAVFLHAGTETTPLALRANVEHNHALHHCVVILTVEVQPIPRVAAEHRLEVDELGYADDGITHVLGRFGFSEAPDVPALLRLAAERGLERPIDVEAASYYLSRINLAPTSEPTMALWRKRLFVAMARNAASATDWFNLPEERTVVMGYRIDF